MKFFGKEVPVDKVNFVTNIISFVLGVIFFIRMQYKLNEKTPTPIVFNSEHDSMIAIQTRVNLQLIEIKKIQDSIIQTIRGNEQKLSAQIPEIKKERESIYSTIKSGWMQLDTNAKENYIRKKSVAAKIMNKGDTIVAKENQTFVMDKNSFAEYAYASDKYDTLKQKIVEYDSTIAARDSLEQNTIAEYKKLIDQKDSESEVYKNGYEQSEASLQTSIEKNNQLQIDFKKLEQKNKRVKRWRNIFLGTSASLATVIILLVR